MEIGEYLTNVLSINDLASIPFKYLEIPSQTVHPGFSTLSNIEATWRKDGALVVIDTYKSGLWIFGKTSDKESVLPSTASLTADGFVQEGGIQLVVRKEGIFDPSSLWKAVRPIPTPTSSQTGASSPAQSTDATARAAQALNAKTVQSNASPAGSQEQGAIISIKSDDTTADRVFSSRDLYERLLSAILASLSYRLCHDSGFVALNARTLIFTGSSLPFKRSALIDAGGTETQDRTTPWMATLDIYLTAHGTLVVNGDPTPSLDFSCVANAEPDVGDPQKLGHSILLYLAPTGSIAKYYIAGDIEESSTTFPPLESSESKFLASKPHLKHAIHHWKQRCIQWLENKGIQRHTYEDGGWIMVQILLRPELIDEINVEKEGLYTPEETPITIAWPLDLCFLRRPSFSSSNVTDLPRGYDPLAFAEKWFTSNADRELTIAKRNKERDAAAAAIKTQAETEARLFATNNHSPVALRRASIAGAVYPTPPDGVPIGATPSFDGNANTPSQPNTQPPPVETDSMLAAKREAEEADNSLFETADMKKDQTNTSLEFADTGNDLFGDLGGDDLFGENDITDADFSFFDEPDILEEKNEDSLVMTTAADKEAEMEIATTNDNSSEIRSGDTVVTVNKADIEMHDAQPSPIAVPGDDSMDTSSAAVVNADQVLPDNSAAKISLTAIQPRTPSPPLSPELVFKRLSTVDSRHEDANRTSGLDRKLSAFEGVDFDASLSMFNQKYGVHGRFKSSFSKKSLPQSTPIALPNTGYLVKRRKTAVAAYDRISKAVKSLQQSAAPQPTETNSDAESPGTSRSGSGISDQDDTSTTTEEGQLMSLSNLKRKHSSEGTDDEDEMTSSFKDLNVEPEQSNGALDPLDMLDPILLEPDPADWSLAKYFSCPEPLTSTISLGDVAYVATAQILSEQAIYRTLKIAELTNLNNSEHTSVSIVASLVQKRFARATEACFGRRTECNMATYSEIQGQYPTGQLNRLPPRPVPHPQGLNRPDPLKPSPTFSLPAPHLQVRRADTKLAVLPSAVPFWEVLGLGPSRGGKDISAACVYPDGEGMTSNIDAFLEHTRSAYESNKFGTHERFSHTDFPDGHVPVDFGEGANSSVAVHQAVLGRITEVSTKLGRLLASTSLQDTNIVIYYVYDSNSPELLVPICSAFHDLFSVYKDKLSDTKSPATNELVLQLVPMDFIAAHTSLVVPQPFEYARLAMEVYDRCVELTSGTTSPSIVLEPPLPRNIEFKLTPNPSASLLQENSIMHVAYAQSIDDRWITAAWTDNTGNQQVTASYCLGRKSGPLTITLHDIAHEIWETTLDIISIRKVHWRIMIAKCGVMEPFEMEFWKGLAGTESKAQVSLTLITVDTTPSLKLLPHSISIPPTSLTAQSTFYTTPVSTPSASVISPEQSGNPQTPHGPTNAPTPGGDSTDLKIEPDATLVDITDQTWGCILGHCLNNSRSLLEFNPALISGYLIKRSGSSLTDAPVVIEINIVHSEMNPRLYEALLREVLANYRGLATLARARGVVEPDKDGRPLHIAAAEKGVEILHLLM